MAPSMELDQKYQALLAQAQQQRLPQADNIRLCFETLSLASRIDRDCASLLAPHGLTEGRFVMLFLLAAANDGLAPHALAQQAGISRATVTGLLDGLERDGLIARHAEAADRRALRIRLTEHGLQVAHTVFAQHTRWISTLFAPLTEPERMQLSGLLNKVAQGLPATKHGAMP